MILSVHHCPRRTHGKNPPTGAMIDYFLKSPASRVTLEFFDPQHNLVRRFSSEDQSTQGRIIPVAERWFPKPEVPAKTPGTHRFMWDLTWVVRVDRSPMKKLRSAIQRSEGRPGIYQVRLTIDGQFQSEPLQVAMDPRSSATPEVLLQQLQLGNQIFAETVEARRALAEIASVQKRFRKSSRSSRKRTRNSSQRWRRSNLE